jgi:hypothetical protein
MAIELIITSVRKGLDGGSGYQPVLRTKDLKPAIAERLQLRSGYSHPYPHGDRRNPVVHVHRIERVAGEVLHVIARICDAGSDHTGRSNFLAHFVAMDDSEARRKPAGPAEVMRRMPFRAAWDEPARESDPPTVVGGDRHPAPCQAWKAAGLDPGIAGDLAEAAMGGREVTLISRESDDVLQLFADALALVAPAKRWQVTFNTCRIEPFDGTWQAIRSDLPQARAARSNAGVIDLATDPRGGDGPYAAYARGEATVLPWQQTAKPVLSGGEERDEPVGVTPSPQAVNAGDGPAPPSVIAAKNRHLSAPPRPKRRTRREYEDPIPDGESPDRLAAIGRRLMWLALGAMVLLPLVIGGVVVLRPDLLPDWTTGSTVVAITPDAGHATARTVDLGEAEKERRRREHERLAEQERQRKKQEDEAKAAADRQAKADEEKKREEEKRRAEMDAEKREREKSEKKERAAQAFAALQKLPAIVVQDLVAGVEFGTPSLTDVDLGAFDVEALQDPGFALAVPKEKCDGQDFRAWVEEVPGNQRSWRVLATSRAIDGGEARPLPLAMLTARDGNLHLKAADLVTVSNPRFKLLRRSVLLVKARDPAEPKGRATVQRTIQLVRPAAGKLHWDVSLLEGRQTFSLPRPPDTTTAAAGSQSPVLPGNAKVAYEVQFYYPLKYNGGEPLDKPVAYRFDSDDFCPLLECPPPHSALSIGVNVEIGLDAGDVVIHPEVSGPDKNKVNLDNIAAFVKKIKTQKQFDDWFRAEAAPLRSSLASIKKTDVRRFLGSDAERKFRNLIQVKNPELPELPKLEEFLKEKNHCPPSKPDGKHVDAWLGKCNGIIERVSKAVNPESLAVASKDWQQEMSILEDWLDYYIKKWRELKEKNWKEFQPLTGPAIVVVTELSSPAYDAEGKRYDVVLATAATAQPAGPRGTDTTD